MDSAQRCLGQSAECRRLVHLARSKAEAHASEKSFSYLVGTCRQIDRYNALMREQRRGGQRFSAEGSGEQGLPYGVTGASRRSEMADEDLINERLLAVLGLVEQCRLLDASMRWMPP
jgi:hypothetical protein